MELNDSEVVINLLLEEQSSELQVQTHWHGPLRMVRRQLNHLSPSQRWTFIIISLGQVQSQFALECGTVSHHFCLCLFKWRNCYIIWTWHPLERVGSGHGMHGDETEVGHAYGPARNSVSRMVSKHCKINVETALEVRFCTCPVARTRSCRSTILGSQIVEMGPYCSYVSVALGCRNFTARAS